MSNSLDIKKIHFIYKTINLLNGKYYIGMHSTNNLSDGYIGSGKRLKYAIKRYGRQNFKLEILEFCENRNILSQKEKEFITKNHIEDKNCYNLKFGGLGGGKFYSKEHQLKCSQAAGKKHSLRIKNDEEYRKKYSEKISNANKRRYTNGDLKLFLDCGKNNFKGKKHKESSKKLIGEKNSVSQKGNKNSQYGTFWINKDNVNKKIKKNELVSFEKDGWVLGRYQPYKGELSGSNKLTEIDVIEIKKMISENKLSSEQISKQFNVTRQTINKIKNKEIWKHID